jgi:hypothetical protein
MAKRASSERSASYAEARQHFLKTAAKRTRRAALLDTWRSRKRTWEPRLSNSSRYLQETGPFRADFWHVDDGSPNAKAIFNPQRYREPNRETKGMTQTLLESARQIGQGREATIWRKDGRVVKLFDDNVPLRRIKENIAFLKNSNGTSANFHRADLGERYIVMSELRNYHPLSSYIGNALPDHKWSVDKKSAAKVNALLRALAIARVRLGKNVEYKDLDKLDNIAVKFGKDGLVSSIKFYEGGKRERYNDTERAAEFVVDLAHKLHLVRHPFVQQISNYEVPWIR